MRENSATFEAACQRLSEGQSLEAEKMLVAAVHAANRNHGAVSLEHAHALFELSCIYLAIGDLENAAAALHTAADSTPKNDEGERDRLTYLMNLGDVLIRAGALPQAEGVLRDSLKARESYYGPDHAGYAFGLKPLAEAVWLQGRQAEAAEMVEQAVELLWREANPEVTAALALRAYILESGKSTEPLFAHFPALPEELADNLISEVLDLSERIDPYMSMAVLQELADAVADVRGDESPTLLGTWSMIAEKARIAGEQGMRCQALQVLHDICAANNDLMTLIKVEEALALAYSEAGRHADAETAYRSASQHGRDSGNRALYSAVLRNYGLYLAELERADEAEQAMRTAVTEAEASGEQLYLGEALAALGIFLQHGGRFDEASGLLRRALDVLPTAHPTSVCTRDHLSAYEQGQRCRCNETTDSVPAVLKEMIMAAAPPGLLEDVILDLESKNVQFKLMREPNEEEMEELRRVYEHAVRRLQSEYDKAGYAR